MSIIVADRSVAGCDTSVALGVDLRSLLGISALAANGEAPALHVDDDTVSYVQLADLVADRAARLGIGRRLVAITGDNNLDMIVTLLACFERRLPVLLAGATPAFSQLTEIYRPDTIVACSVSGAVIGHQTPVDEPSPIELHESLAVLLSTSGSTGTAKLVRLSAGNVASNAAAIASYLGLGTSDCAITSLPIEYCYGLSVVTSHLAVGGAVAVTNSSVVDPCFRSVFERHGVTNLAAVPYTFELLDRGGADILASPALRFVTQAGGRLEPSRVRELADLGSRAAWDLYVMYGQTEATARMAYLPPDLAADHPSSVGVAIPGGEISIEVDACDEPRDSGIGEVVFRGPNVMMGYATSATDLATGSTVAELRTGDLGRIDDDGLLHLVGRTERFLKIHGKRVDLDHIESVLGGDHPSVRCTGDDELLVVAVERGGRVGTDIFERDLVQATTRVAAIPAGRVTALVVDEMPRTASGKVDRPALLASARDATARKSEIGADSIAAAFELVLGRVDVNRSASFADLGGDSFSYVEMSIRLESIIGALPQDWHLIPVAELETLASSARRRRFVTNVETSVLIRAAGIALIVCTHMGIYRLAGGAHTLLAIVGFNFARFQLTSHEVGARVRSAIATVARIAVPTSVWIALNALLFGGYSLGAVLLVNNYTGAAARRDGRWEYWYFETFVQVMVVLAIVFSIGAVRRAERRAPFVFALGLLVITWLFRFEIVELGGRYNYLFRTHTVASFVVLGWLAYRARSMTQKLIVTAATVATAFGYFGQSDREWRIIAMVCALIWIPRVVLPTPFARVVGVVAAASMWIFLVHWQVWPLFTPWLDDRVAYLLTMGSGVIVWWLYERARATINTQRRRRSVGRSTSSHVSTADTAISVSEARPVTA